MNRKLVVSILAIVLVLTMVLSLILSVIPVKSRAEGIQNNVSVCECADDSVANAYTE